MGFQILLGSVKKKSESQESKLKVNEFQGMGIFIPFFMAMREKQPL